MTNEPETMTEDRAGDAAAAGDTPDEQADDTPDADAADAADIPAEDADAPTDDAADAAAEGAEGADAAPGDAPDHGGDAGSGDEPQDDQQPDWEQRATDDGRTAGQLLAALAEVQSDRDDYLDALQRSRAEFDNFRRRSAREAAVARAAGVGDLATQLLDVLDDLDRTVKVAENSSDEGLAAGITAVRRKLVDALLAAGVERIEEEDVPFDATRHEAVQKVDAEEDLDEPEVAQVLRPGYVHGDRVLRAAMVSVRQ